MTNIRRSSWQQARKRVLGLVRDLVFAAAVLASMAVPQAGAQIETGGDGERIANPVATFSGLDKVTGRIVNFQVNVNETVQFGSLQVTPRTCYTRPTTEQPETIGFIEVDEITLQNETKRIFTGWMFADSPGLNAVEHPIYDVWLTDCTGGARPEPKRGPVVGE